MIKVNKLLITLLVCFITTSLHAVKVEVMPTVGKAFKAEDDSLKDDEVLYGIRGTVFLNDEVAVQAAFEASTNNEIRNHPGAKTDLERVSANVVYEKNLNSRIRPYAMVGVGNESTHGTVAPKTNDGSQGFVNVGAGLKFGISKHVDLVTEARWIRKLSNDDDDIIATVGLGVNTGTSTSTSKREASIPSVTETSDVQNAINLAEFRKISQQKATQAVAKKAQVATTATTATVTTLTPAPAVVSEAIPADAIVLEEDATIPENAVEEGSLATDIIEEVPATQEGYYVQMAALFQGRGEALTNRLEQKDYPYVLHNIEKNGREATLVLVGPYQSRVEASVAMKYLKRLKKDAFIYHMN
jgi:cell division septation protein DedD